jgi:hypothetical protein
VNSRNTSFNLAFMKNLKLSLAIISLTIIATLALSWIFYYNPIIGDLKAENQKLELQLSQLNESNPCQELILQNENLIAENEKLKKDLEAQKAENQRLLEQLESAKLEDVIYHGSISKRKRDFIKIRAITPTEITFTLLEDNSKNTEPVNNGWYEVKIKNNNRYKIEVTYGENWNKQVSVIYQAFHVNTTREVNVLNIQ